jgi:pyruvate dehydrogenase E1 component alpha subunit
MPLRTSWTTASQQIEPWEIGSRKMAAALSEALEAIEERIKAQVEEAIAFAEASPLPDASELYNDVYSDPGYPFVND